ncbi:MFS transporter [Prolixibacteraceae bacterium Z1-6]|uniref:MFS transporter n=1 Tax=Draconibacterium aestuarii TaxID=2998507 RepID=A0A9X3J7P9_9BACT|nr:MFS transporter [Prolixibacteraceae bacterium Z1-6]
MKNSWKIIVLAIICFVLGTSEFVIVGVLDKIALSTNITIAQAGQLISVFAITAAIGTPIAIYFMAGINQRKILMTALSIIVVACVLMSVAYNYQLLILARIIMALGVGIFNVYCFIAASKLAPEWKRASAIATVTVGFNAALIVGLPVGRVVTSLFGWQTIFWFTAVFSLISIYVVYKYIPPLLDEKPENLKKQLSILKRPRLIVSFFVSFFWITGYAMLYSYITPYLKNTSLMTESMISVALFAFGVATLIGNKSGAYVGEKTGRSENDNF